MRRLLVLQMWRRRSDTVSSPAPSSPSCVPCPAPPLPARKLPAVSFFSCPVTQRRTGPTSPPSGAALGQELCVTTDAAAVAVTSLRLAGWLARWWLMGRARKGNGILATQDGTCTTAVVGSYLLNGRLRASVCAWRRLRRVTSKPPPPLSFARAGAGQAGRRLRWHRSTSINTTLLILHRELPPSLRYQVLDLARSSTAVLVVGARSS